MSLQTFTLQSELTQELNSKTVFRNLEINTVVGMGFSKHELPVLEVKLKSENHQVFTMFLQPDTKTGCYPVTNMLTMAKQIHPLYKSRFNSLQIPAKDSREWPENYSLKILIHVEEE